MIKFHQILQEIGINHPIYGSLGIRSEEEFNNIISKLCKFSTWVEFNEDVPVIATDEYISINDDITFPIDSYRDIRNQCITYIVGKQNFKKNYKLYIEAVQDLEIGIEWCGVENHEETYIYPYNLYDIHFDDTVYFPLRNAIYPIKSKKELCFQILKYFKN